ncbi:hypothetical protein KIPB_007855 [Kipferlia bialata]|uniref:TNFR-Cys domain-containing protein n=1 Tax=Kipferlia bialata TaxID=797122 RepID=A0A391NX97_9EUKA|nr:hypothetical protein KIPB_007855 [Kipferlia bialata]|eukprot:g7855.t1
MRVCILLLVALISLCLAGCSFNGRSCTGTCPNDGRGDNYCIEYKPGHCQCMSCAFDYALDRCVGGCTAFPGSSPGCLLTSNSTCACVDCGWGNTSLKSCVGSCSSTSCYSNHGCQCGQPSEDSALAPLRQGVSSLDTATVPAWLERQWN